MSNEQEPATLNDVVTSISKIQTSLDKIATWLNISGVEKVKKVLEKELDKPEKILIYHNSLKNKSIRKIKEFSGAGLGTISQYHSAWFKLGLMKKIIVSRKDHYVKNFDLENYCINIPTLPSTNVLEQAELLEERKYSVPPIRKLNYIPSEWIQLTPKQSDGPQASTYKQTEEKQNG